VAKHSGTNDRQIFRVWATLAPTSGGRRGNWFAQTAGVKRLLRTFDVALPWPALFKRTWTAISKGNVMGLAAQLAFYFLLALVPALVFVVSLVSFLPADPIQAMMQQLRAVAPPSVAEILQNQLTEIMAGQHGGLLTLGILATIWSSSAAMVAIIDTLNRAYDIDESRPWWKARLTAVLLTIGTAMFIVIAFGLVMLGPMAAEWVARQTAMPQIEWIWKIGQWPLIFALIVLAIGLVYYFAPDAEQEWEWITPGATLATVLWLLASLGFRLYVTNFTDYNETYGSLGAIVVLMMWFYLSAAAVLIGAEFNAEIEHASPHGKAPGEKVAGQKRQLGWLAAQTYAARLRGENPDRPRRPVPRLLPAPAAPRGWLAVSIPLLLTRLFARKRRNV
jgi:membrane protein